MYVGAQIQIDLAALTKNFNTLYTFYKKLNTPPQTQNKTQNNTQNKVLKICVSVKADAYGHGLVECAKALENINNFSKKKQKDTPQFFGVASVAEIALLKDAHIKKPVLLYSMVSSADLQKLFLYNYHKNVEFFVGDKNYLKDILKASKKHGEEKIKIHLKCDTGMGRVGVLPKDFAAFYEEVLSYKNVEIVGLCTHLSDSSKDNVTLRQHTQFFDVIKNIQKTHPDNFKKVILHAANSGALLWQQFHNYGLGRVGIALYGVNPEPSRLLPAPVVLKPVMKLYADVIAVKKIPKNHGVSYSSMYKPSKDTHIAIINVGYGDGIPVALSNTGLVRIKNKNYAIVGRVCMDMLMVDVGNNSKNITRGDRAILWGDTNLRVEEQAGRANTIAYELLCNMSIVRRGIRNFV